MNWKVREERKVADLVVGSRMFEKHINAIIAAAHDTRVPEHARLDPAFNASLRQAIREAIALGIPSGATQNALDYARQGYTRLEVEQYDTAWDSEAYITVSGQNSNNSVRLTNEFFNALDRDDDWQLKWRTTGDVASDQGARAVGADRRSRMAVGRSRSSVRRYYSRMAHLRRRRADQRYESMRYRRHPGRNGRRPAAYRGFGRQGRIRHRRRRPPALRQ